MNFADKHTINNKLSVALLFTALLGVGCGGNDGSSANRLSDEEFCAKVSAVQDLGNASNDVSAAVDDLIASAPNDEIRNALETLAPIIAEVEGVDESDPEAFSKIMDLMLDPEVVKAGQVLDKYSTDVCGITEDTSSDDFSSSTDSIVQGQSGDIFSDVDSTILNNYIASNGADFIGDGHIDSTSIDVGDGQSNVVVDVVESTTLDSVELCKVVAEGVSLMTTDTAVEIIIRDNGVDAAVRKVGGECVPA